MTASLHHVCPTQQLFRETGKFKPIQQHQQLTERHQNSTFTLSSLRQFPIGTEIIGQEVARNSFRIWRLYLQQNIEIIPKQTLNSDIIHTFEFLEKCDALQDSSELFLSINNILVERFKCSSPQYNLSFQDYNCMIITLRKVDNKGARIFNLDCYFLGKAGQLTDRQYTEDILIKMRHQYIKFYLFSRAKSIYITKDISKSYPVLELTKHNLQQTIASPEKGGLIIKNLSPRIVALKFQEQSNIRDNQPLLIVIPNQQIFQLILYKINRIKYSKHKIQENQIKQWHSFDFKMQAQCKKYSKIVPERLKSFTKPQASNNLLNKISNLSVNTVDQISSPDNRKSYQGPILSQQKHLKISQRIGNQSNLAKMEIDDPVSVRDQKDKDSQYLDQFQNLLFEQQGGEQQLALNDSFQKFEKKQTSQKNLKIINQLNKRKVKETEENKIMNDLKQKLAELIAQQKEWINKNLKLKIDIKKLKYVETTTEQNKEIEENKLKIAEFKLIEKKLVEDLDEIKKINNIETLVFGEQSTEQNSQSHRNKEKIYQSINLPTNNLANNTLTTSVRSNESNYYMRPQPQVPINSLSGSKSINGSLITPTLRTNLRSQQMNPQTNPNQPFTYTQPYIPSQNVIHYSQPTIQGQMLHQGNSSELINKEYIGYGHRMNTNSQHQMNFINGNYSSSGNSYVIKKLPYPPGGVKN